MRQATTYIGARTAGDAGAGARIDCFCRIGNRCNSKRGWRAIHMTKEKIKLILACVALIVVVLVGVALAYALDVFNIWWTKTIWESL